MTVGRMSRTTAHESCFFRWPFGGDGHPILKLDGPWLKICHLRGINQTLLKHGIDEKPYLITLAAAMMAAMNLCEFNPKLFSLKIHVSSGKNPLGCDSSKVFLTLPILGVLSCDLILFAG